MDRQDIEALLQGSLDDTLTPEQRDTLRRLLAESAELRGRADHLEQLTELLESLPLADAPPRLAHDVLERISRPAGVTPARSFVRVAAPKRGVPVKKSMIFGLAAAAAVVLAVITYYNYPPETDGTEATIGAAQRAQQPQIAAKDVGLGDTSAQDLLQSETWDAIMKDEDLRSSLQDPDLRQMLGDADLRRALEDGAVRGALRQPDFAAYLKRGLSDAALSEAEARKMKLNAAFANESFARALRNNKKLAASLLNARAARALSSDAMARALRDPKFEAALRQPRFAEALARGK